LTLPVGNALPVPLAVDSDAPAVVLYSSRTDNATVVAAALAGAGAVVGTSEFDRNRRTARTPTTADRRDRVMTRDPRAREDQMCGECNDG
jgi:hypothetical protein